MSKITLETFRNRIEHKDYQYFYSFKTHKLYNIVCFYNERSVTSSIWINAFTDDYKKGCEENTWYGTETPTYWLGSCKTLFEDFISRKKIFFSCKPDLRMIELLYETK